MSHELDFTGTTVLVVGGSSGIGNGIAQGFRAVGARVLVWGTRADAAAYEGEAGSDLNGLDYASVEVTDADAVTRAAAGIAALDALILCQGAVQYGRQEFAQAGWSRVVDVNLNSVMTAAMALRPLLAAARGSLVIISSVAAFRATRGNPAYAASKAGAVALTRSLAASWAAEGIRVNGIAPGLVATKLTAVTTSHPARLAASLASIPAGRLGTPADMAGAAMFLCSPLAAYVVGQTLVVDGGLTLA